MLESFPLIYNIIFVGYFNLRYPHKSHVSLWTTENKQIDKILTKGRYMGKILYGKYPGAAGNIGIYLNICVAH